MEKITLLPALLNFVKAIGETREKKSQAALDVLLAINNAAKETLKYEAWRDANQGARNKEREQEVSAGWYGVSYRMLAYSTKKTYTDLAQRLQFKGDYWQAPEEWTQLEITDAGIGLIEIVAECERLLKPYLKPL